jgi:hypothetical protein
VVVDPEPVRAGSKLAQACRAVWKAGLLARAPNPFAPPKAGAWPAVVVGGVVGNFTPCNWRQLRYAANWVLLNPPPANPPLGRKLAQAWKAA